MILTDVVGIVVPVPDSQFRLRPCRSCGGDNTAYVRYARHLQYLWRVQCFDCNYTVDKGCPIQHDAQLAWNYQEDTLGE